MKRILTGFLLVFLFLSQTYGQQTTANFIFNVVCPGETTTLTSTSTTLPGDSIIEYRWDTTWNDGILNPVLGTPPFGPEVKVHFPGPGVYEIGLKIYTKNDLMESVYKQIAVTDVKAEFSSMNFCLGDETQFTDLSTVDTSANITNWTWSFGDSYASTQQNPKHVYGNFGTFSASLTVTTDNGCTAQATNIVTINDLPHFTVDYSLEPVDIIMGVPVFQFYEDQSLTATVNADGTVSNITWLPSWETTPSILVHQTGDWSVTVTNELGCKAMSNFVVTVLEDKEVQPIPVITPNGDGSNDVFKVKRYLLPGDQYELAIFNRYGHEIYSSSNYQNDWDGKYEGTLVPEGPYYYFLKDKSGKEWKGPINVVYNY